MRAVALTAARKLELIEVPEPDPAAGELKLRVRYCGICGSDLHEYETDLTGRSRGAMVPIMGHEFSGEVLAAGRDVDGFSPGDLVVVNPGEPCSRCFYCNKGLPNLCELALVVGYRRPGAYAERLCVRAASAVKLPPGTAADSAALTEPLAVALHAVNQADLAPDDTVFISGGGPIGLLAVIAARRRGAHLVILSEPLAQRRDLAARIGAHEVIDPTATAAPARVRELTDGLGADVALECAGVTAAFTDAFGSIRRGGRLVAVGLIEQPYPISLLMTTLFEYHIIGILCYGEEFAEAAGLIASGEVDVRPLISARVGLSAVPALFEQLISDRSHHLKVLMSPDI